VPVTDAYEIQQAEAGAGVFHTLYSKIDSSRYKVSRVDFYVHQDRPKDRRDLRAISDHDLRKAHVSGRLFGGRWLK